MGTVHNGFKKTHRKRVNLQSTSRVGTFVFLTVSRHRGTCAGW